jgi:RNA polymerase sigma-70 factor, ECF subfamily
MAWFLLPRFFAMFEISRWQWVGTLDESDAVSRAVLETQRYQALRRALEQAVRRVCPKSLAEDAEDLVQESLIRLLRARKLSSQSEVSGAYLKKVAYSAVIDEIRRRRRRPPIDSASAIDLESASDVPSTPAPDTSLGNALETCLQRLHADRRRALTLHLLGYSGAEVASMLGCNLKRAENLTLRGLAQLREYLNEMGLWP